MKTNVMLQILWKPRVLPEGPAEDQKLRRVLRTTFCIDFSKFFFTSKKFTLESRSKNAIYNEKIYCGKIFK